MATDAKEATDAKDMGHAGQFARILLIPLAVVLLLFAAYEIIERAWLLDLDMETLHMLHRVRGFLIALVAASLVGWFILRQSQPLFATALAPEEWSTGAGSRAAQRINVYARWFIQMRWIAVVVAFTLVVVTVQVVELLPHVVWWPLMLTVATLTALNIGYTVFLGRGRTTSRLLVFQAYADLFLLTILLHFSGSIENPLAPLMLFHVVIAGIILSRRQCFVVAIVGGSLFATLAGLELSGLVHHYTLEIFPHQEHEGALTHAAREPLYVASHVVLHATILLLTAFFVTTLADRLRRDERQLERYAERISTERQLLAQALETTGTALSVCGPDMRPTFQNLQWSNWFGNETGSSLHHEVFSENSPARKTLQDGQVRIWEMECNDDRSSNVDESLRTFLTTTAPLTDQDGIINRVVQLVQEITEQKRIQAGLMRAGKLAAVGEMAGEVAHEVNNPVAIISAKARLLLANHRGEISAKVAEELIKITDMSDRIARITQGLLSYSRPSAGARLQLDARMPVRKALALVEQRTRSARVEVVDRMPDEALGVMANADELEQVFLNLFLNAVDAMQAGGTLTVKATTTDDNHTIAVEDTGEGIDAEARDRIFEPFFTTKPEGEGTGLGLSICVGLIRSHAGSIELTRNSGRGTTAMVTLPRCDLVEGE